jgi:hypothetical protein
MTRTLTRKSAAPPTRLSVFSSRKPQQLRLQRRHHLPDLVEKDGAAVGRLQQAALLPIGTGERPPFVPKSSLSSSVSGSAEQVMFMNGLAARSLA